MNNNNKRTAFVYLVNLYNTSAFYNKKIYTYDEGVYCIDSRDASQ